MTNTLFGGSDATVEVSANTDHLGHFADRGQIYVERLEHIAATVREQRALVAAALGNGVGPADVVTAAFEEMIAEAALNNAFVDQIRSSLLDESADRGGSVADAHRIDQDLRAHGLLLDGTDELGADDQLLLQQLRIAELNRAGMRTEDLAPSALRLLTGNSAVFRSAQSLMSNGANPEAVAAASTLRIQRVGDYLEADRAAVGLASVENRESIASPEHLDALLTGAYSEQLHNRILSGALPPPTDRIRDRVVDAMVAGLGPGDVGVADAYFPARYLRSLDLASHIADAEARREVADGSSWSWWDSDDAALASIDAELALLRSEQEALLAEHRVGEDGALAPYDAVAATSDANGGARWEGQIYGTDLIGFHDARISGGGIFGSGKGAIKDPNGFDVELRHIGHRISSDQTIARSFYNTIGLERSSNLATFLVGNDLSVGEVARFGEGLALASRSTTVDGRSGLSFSGAELIGHQRPPTQDGVLWYNPATLFATGDFDDRFLADAAEATLALAEAGNDQGLVSHDGWADASQGIRGDYGGGEDPRNILLARVAEGARATRFLLWALGGPTGRGWPGSPPAGSLDALLNPSTSYRPAIGPDHEPYWVDELLSDRIRNPNHPAVDKVGYPDLAPEYPIAALLATASGDPELSRWILRYVADSVRRSGPLIQDSGTAAGLDMILARHSTVMFDPADLASVGITPSLLNQLAEAPVSPTHWRTVYDEVLRHGRGQALAVAAAGLLDDALVGALDEDGWLHADKVAPFAHAAGRADAEAFAAITAHHADLDEKARERNRRVSLAISIAAGVTGLIPYAGLPASASSTTWGWFAEGYPTTSELEARRERDQLEAIRSDLIHWNEVVAAASLEARLTSPDPRIEVGLTSSGPHSVPIRRGRPDDDPAPKSGVMWQHPVSQLWHPVPTPLDSDKFFSLFGQRKDYSLNHGQAVAAGIRVQSHHRYGAVVAVANGADHQALVSDEFKESETVRIAMDNFERQVEPATAAAGWTDTWFGGEQP